MDSDGRVFNRLKPAETMAVGADVKAIGEDSKANGADFMAIDAEVKAVGADAKAVGADAKAEPNCDLRRVYQGVLTRFKSVLASL